MCWAHTSWPGRISLLSAHTAPWNIEIKIYRYRRVHNKYTYSSKDKKNVIFHSCFDCFLNMSLLLKYSIWMSYPLFPDGPLVQPAKNYPPASLTHKKTHCRSPEKNPACSANHFLIRLPHQREVSVYSPGDMCGFSIHHSANPLRTPINLTWGSTASPPDKTPCAPKNSHLFLLKRIPCPPTDMQESLPPIAGLPARYPEGLPARYPEELPVSYPEGLPVHSPEEFPARWPNGLPARSSEGLSAFLPEGLAAH